MVNQLKRLTEFFYDPPPAVEDEFHGVVLGYVWPASILLFSLHFIVTLTHLVQMSHPQWLGRVTVTGLTGLLVLAGIIWQIRRPLKTSRVYSFSFVFLLLPIMLDNLGQYYLTRDTLIVVQVFLVSMLMGYFLLDSRWMMWQQLANIVSIAALVVILDGILVLLDYLTFGLGALVGALFLHVAHRQTLISQIDLRQKEREARLIADGLQMIGTDLTSNLSRQKVVQGILDNLTKVLECDRVSVLIHEGQELVVAASLGFPAATEQDGGTRIFIGDAGENDIFPTIVRTRRAFLIPDVRRRPEWVHVEGMAPAVGFLGLPLLAQNEVIGMLSLVRTSPQPFLPQEIHSAELFANQAAIALQNAALYEQVTAFNQTLEQQVQERTADLEKAYEQLTRLDQAKSEFITIMSHEIRTPLTVLRGYIQMLGRDEELLAHGKRGHYIRGLDAGSLRLQELVESLFILVRIENNSLDVYWSELQVGDLISIVSNNLESVIQARNLSFRLADNLFQLPPIVGDYELLETVFNQLLLNAIKYTPDGGKIEVGGQMVAQNVNGHRQAGIQLCIKDTGIGVPKEIQELIFTKFYQGGRIELHSSSKTKFKGGGAGLGLSIANGIVAIHEGKIWVESDGLDEEKLPGSRFFVWLPIEGPETRDRRPENMQELFD